VCTQRWDAGASLEEVVIPQIVASPAHVQRLTVETNGLGWMPTEVLFRRWRERADAAGGGLESSHEAIHPKDLDRLWRGPGGGSAVQHNGRTYPDRHLVPKPLPGVAAPPQPFETRLRAIHTTAEVKATAYSAMRLLIDRGAVLLPRDATELRRELLLLRVELAQGGTEKVEAAIGHDDSQTPSPSHSGHTAARATNGGAPGWLTSLTRRCPSPPPPSTCRWACRAAPSCSHSQART